MDQRLETRCNLWGLAQVLFTYEPWEGAVSPKKFLRFRAGRPALHIPPTR